MLLFGDNYESVLLISDHITSSNLLYQQQFVTDNIKVKNNSNKRSVAFSGCCQMNRKSSACVSYRYENQSESKKLNLFNILKVFFLDAHISFVVIDWELFIGAFI